MIYQPKYKTGQKLKSGSIYHNYSFEIMKVAQYVHGPYSIEYGGKYYKVHGFYKVYSWHTESFFLGAIMHGKVGDTWMYEMPFNCKLAIDVAGISIGELKQLEAKGE
jgi:hypothetical protein